MHILCIGLCMWISVLCGETDFFVGGQRELRETDAIAITEEAEKGEEGEDREEEMQYGEEAPENEMTPYEVQEELLSCYDFTELDKVMQEMGGVEAITFEELVQELMTGDIKTEASETEKWKQEIYQVFLSELNANRGIMIKLIVLAMITALYSNMSGPKVQGMVSENGFYVTYLIMTALFVSSYSLIYQVAWQTIEDILGIMQTLIPTYMMAVGMSSGVASSVILQSGLVFGITTVSWSIEKVVFPVIQLFVVIGLVNNLLERDHFSKLAELMQTLVNWMLKSVLAVVVGVNTIKSMMAPATDSVTTTALQRGLTVIPGGQAITAVSGVVIGSGVLIKNAIGMGGIIILALTVSVPVIKMTVFILLYKMLAAILQPIADPRMIRGLNSISQGGQLLISAVLSVIVLFMVSIAVIAVSTNVAYYAG